MKKLLCLIAMLCVSSIYSQTSSYKISGIVKDEKDKSLLESATIHLEKMKDSSVVSYTISNDKGFFSLEGKTYEKELRLYVSFIGLKTYSKKITISNKSIDLGEILMKPEENVLDEVVIKSRAPITVKKDTLEFNVKSFKTKKDASVEDLLKKLPGVEVDDQGKITVNGKPVNKILVNGKPFFGNDPSIVTKNLTKEIIEKVQISDTKTKSEAFTGQKGDKNNKTINLTIKKENNKGWFGRLAAGGGTDKHYEYAALVNRFDNDTRFSVLLGGNDINSPGFSFGEIQKMFGSGGSIMISEGGAFSIGSRSFGGGQGIIKSKNGGFTYADVFGKKVDVNADYFYSGSNSMNESSSNRENFLPTSSYFSKTKGKQDNEYNNHNFNTEIDIKVDSTFLINIRPSFTFNNRKGVNTNMSETFDENNVLKNRSDSKSIVDSKNNNFKNTISLTKKLGNRGAYLKTIITNQIDKNTGDNYNISEIEVVNTSTEKRNQYIDTDAEFRNLETSFSYRLPLVAKKMFLNFDYNYSNNTRENIKSTYDFDNNTQAYTTFNTLLSSNFTYKNTKKTPSVQFSYNTKKGSFRLRGGYAIRTIGSNDKLRPNLNLTRDFEAFEANANFHYRFDSKASIYTSYRLSNSTPSVSQIQPFVDETNPLNIITGNTGLKPTKNHSFSVSYNKYNFQKGTGFYLYTQFRKPEDQIVTKSIIDPVTFVRNTTYENVNGNYNIYLSGSYSKKIKLDSIRSLRLRLGGYSSIRKNINYNNGVKYSSLSKSFTPNVRLTFDWRKVIKFTPYYSISLSQTTFDTNNFSTQNFVRHNLGFNTKTLSSKKLEWRNDIRYSYNPDVVSGFQKGSWFWNSTVAYSVLKDKGTISLKAYDLLNQNTNVRRVSNSNYIEDAQSTVLQQYFMLSFSWKFNSLGKKGKVSDFDFDF